ncbi:MAG: cytochrome-c oxidase, cbb3-type subunit III [Pseudomonadales bacterium]
MSVFWSAWIIGLTILTLILLVWLLFATRKMKVDRDDNTTGHVYDGIVEEDNPLPAWWFTMFILTIVFGVGYLIAYPGLGSFQGVLGWTSAGEHDRKAEQLEKSFASSISEFHGLGVEQLATNTKAINMGRRLFSTNCSVCHGSAGQGGFGFPKLDDNYWQWGGSPEQIVHSIAKGRQAMMIPWKDILGAQNLPLVASYVASLSEAAASRNNITNLNPTDLAKGKDLFMKNCVACHGADGSGNQLLGAPSLNDDIWLYGSSLSEIQVSFSAGRSGQMPAHQGVLSEDKINLVAAYVLSLSADQ